MEKKDLEGEGETQIFLIFSDPAYLAILPLCSVFVHKSDNWDTRSPVDWRNSTKMRLFLKANLSKST